MKKVPRLTWADLVPRLVIVGDNLFVGHVDLADFVGSSADGLRRRILDSRRRLGFIDADSEVLHLACDQAALVVPSRADDIHRAFLARGAIDHGVEPDQLADLARPLGDLALLPLGRVSLEREIFALESKEG